MTKLATKESDESFTDRRNQSGGITAGGRRKSDREDPNKSSKIWFGLSLILTVVIMIWTFSIPFRSKTSVLEWEETKATSHPKVSPAIMRHPEHRMSDETYLSYMRDLDADLLEQVERRNRVPRNLPDNEHAMKHAEKLYNRVKSELAELEKMQKLRKHDFDKKSIEGQKLQSLKDWLASTES